MSILKIAESFNKAHKSYDNFCAVQDLSCEVLIGQLKSHLNQIGCVVDFGCGTGNSTLKIAESFSCAKIFAVDIADKMLNEARKKLQVTFLLANFDQPIFNNTSIDLIFANMAFQWSQNLKQTFQILHNQLVPNGVLAFSMPIDKTFCELHESRINKFYLENDITDMLKHSGFKLICVSNKFYVQHFNSAREALRSIKKTGASFVNKAMYTNTSLDLLDIRSLTYHIGFFVAHKNNSIV